MLPYFYTISSFFFLAIWFVLYIFLPQCRRSIFWTSWNFAPAGPITEYWHYSEYWYPPYLVDIIIGNWHFGVEDYILAFSIAGISSAIFEILAFKKGLENIPAVSAKTYFKMKFWGVIGFGLMIIIASVGLNSTIAIILTMAIVALIIQYRHLNIFSLAIRGAVIFTIIYWLYFIILLIPIFPSVIKTYWNLKNTCGIRLTGIPIEEFIWAFFACLFAGPVYRVCSTKTLFGKY